MRSPRMIAVATSGLLLIGVGAGVALARGTGRSLSPFAASVSAASKKASPERAAFETDVANRLGISRDRLYSAVEAGALADVAFAEDNGFISKTEANLLRQAIRSGPASGFGRLWVESHFGFGLGLGGFPLLGPAVLEGGSFLGRFDPVAAAARYLDMSGRGIMQALRSKTLAQVANDRGKSVGGLEQALRAAAKADWDRWVSQGVITTNQENALLSRFDSEIDDLVHGIPPAITDLSQRLGIERSKVIAAIRSAAIDRVDAARALGLLSKAQAEAIKHQIRTASGVPLGGIGLFCPGPGLPETGRVRAGFGPPGLFLGGREHHGRMEWIGVG